MGSVMSAIRDDEEDWDIFKKQAELPFSVKWGVYSREADYARQVYNKDKVTGNHLVEIVELMLAIDGVREAFRQDRQEYREYLALREKFKGRG
jgi:hypothetical protein